MDMRLTGCGTALITPFRTDGSLDEPALRNLVEWQVQSGVDFLVPCGTTGEASTLSEREWLRVIEITVDAAQARVPVIPGCTHNSTHEAVRRAQRLSEMSGISAVLSANPYYNKPSQEGQYQHFKAIAEAMQLPLVLYNIPSRTGANLEVATVLRLTEIKNIVAIKESSGNLGQITELLNLVPERFAVLAGDDSLALPVLALGGAGLVSVASNAIPSQMSRMCHAALEDDWPSARRLNRQFFGLMQAHFWEPSPAPVKTVLKMLGRCEEVLRLPMVPVSEGTRRRLEEMVGALGLAKKKEQVLESGKDTGIGDITGAR